MTEAPLDGTLNHYSPTRFNADTGDGQKVSQIQAERNDFDVSPSWGVWFSETSACFRAGGKKKIPKLVATIP
jgi:hypothetical protein